jgi:hypothetical protein
MTAPLLEVSLQRAGVTGLLWNGGKAESPREGMTRVYRAQFVVVLMA